MRTILQPNKTVTCTFNGGLCKIKDPNGALIRSTISGVVMVNYLLDHEDVYRPLFLTANQDWRASAIKAIKQDGTTIDASAIIIGLQQ